MNTENMDPQMQACHEDAGRLAAAAVAPDLAVAAADPEIAQAIMTGCLVHAAAAGHRAMLRMAAAANSVLDFALAPADAGAALAQAKAELSAARIAGSCGRVMDEVRLGLVAVGRLRPEMGLTAWHALGWVNGEVSQEEQQRRFAEARDAAANRPAPSATAQERRRAAEAVMADLCREAGVADLTYRGDMTFLRQLFGHQLAAGHGIAMRLYGAADRAFDRAIAARAETGEAERLVSAAARMSGRVRRGFMTQTALSSPPKGGGTTQAWRAHHHTAHPANSTPPAADQGGGIAAHKHYATPGQSRGRLAYGNPSGDYQAAPRCGACTRAGNACRQPAMANGRCRFHGGKSTGPRTAAGLQRSRTARRIHGGYSAEIIDLRNYAAQQARRIRALRMSLVGAGLRPAPPSAPAGHGVDPHDSRRPARPQPNPLSRAGGRGPG